MIDTRPLYKIYKSLSRLTDDNLWINSIDGKVKAFIIQMNTIDQLYNKGIDSLGEKVGGGEYRPLTIAIKKHKGQRYDHFTLKDTGAFYDSWVVKVDRDGLILDADDSSFYDKPLFEVYGEDVLGLTDENKLKLFYIIRENYINYIKNELLR